MCASHVYTNGNEVKFSFYGRFMKNHGCKMVKAMKVHILKLQQKNWEIKGVLHIVVL